MLGKTGNSSRVSLALEVRSRGVIFTRARSTIPEEKWGTSRSLEPRVITGLETRNIESDR